MCFRETLELTTQQTLANVWQLQINVSLKHSYIVFYFLESHSVFSDLHQTGLPHLNRDVLFSRVSPYRSGWASGGAAVCLSGGTACSVTALLLLQYKEFILP